MSELWQASLFHRKELGDGPVLLERGKEGAFVFTLKKGVGDAGTIAAFLC